MAAIPIEKKILQELGSVFKDFNDVRLVYLFGSQVSGNIGPVSDYDFAVLLAELEPPLEYKYRLACQLSNLLNTDKIDLVLLNYAPVELKYNIISTGELLYKRDNFCKVEFEANTLSQYFDYLPILRKQRQDIIKEENYEARVQRSRKAFRKTEKLLKRLRAF